MFARGVPGLNAAGAAGACALAAPALVCPARVSGTQPEKIRYSALNGPGGLCARAWHSILRRRSVTAFLPQRFRVFLDGFQRFEILRL